MLSAISRVVMLCCWTADAMLVDAFANSPIARVIEEISSTDRFGRFLDRGYLLGDVVGGARGLVGERLHLRGDHGETLAGFPGARRLDRGVERQEIGLSGNRRNGADHRADAFRSFGQRTDGVLGAPGISDLTTVRCNITRH